MPIAGFSPSMPRRVRWSGRAAGWAIGLSWDLRADPRHVAQGLLEGFEDGANRRDAWRQDVAAAIAYRETRPQGVGRKNTVMDVVQAVQDVIDNAEDPILVADGGEFGQWSQAFASAPTRVINGPSGAIGGGLCYAIAPRSREPQATVVAMMGDGTAGLPLQRIRHRGAGRCRHRRGDWQ